MACRRRRVAEVSRGGTIGGARVCQPIWVRSPADLEFRRRRGTIGMAMPLSVLSASVSELRRGVVGREAGVESFRWRAAREKAPEDFLWVTVSKG